MPGARPSSFKQGGGGSFNNVDGKITDYEFSTTHPFSDSASNDYIYARVDALIDGADEDQPTAFFVGNAADWEIEDDGKTLRPVDANTSLQQSASFAKFLTSLCVTAEPAFPESALSEEVVNIEPVLGSRVRFIQVADVDAQGKTKMRKATKGKFKGKEFPQTHTEVSKVYELPKAAGKSAKGSTKGKAVEPEADEDELNTLTTETLVGILAKAKDNTILKKKLPVQIMNIVGKHPQREDVRKLMTSDEFLGTEAGWSYNKKTQEIVAD